MNDLDFKNLIDECIEKILNESFLLNENDFLIKVWFTPDGKVVNAGYSHEEWIVNNTDIPKGRNVLDTYDNAIAKGYVRAIYDPAGGMMTLSNSSNYNFDNTKLSTSTRNVIKNYIVNKKISIVASGRGGKIFQL
jgi:hypothetical protein